MPGSGNCACGNIAFTYTALCHCAGCQQWSGSAFSSNVAVPTTNFAVSKGTPKSWARLADVSGKEHRHFFCGDCGSSLYSQPEGMPGVTQIKSGNLHDTAIPIGVEIFATRRLGYVTPIVSANQAPEMP
ncbi:hypothetical protein N7481_007099 [Penicillium waksmanii]|uniref:uncharacterized protein n=1 Tax=Penicillium waksmanii TaxID=69791 RepID=UPI002546DD5B|nr:uncharacterized protein N7481_007099 [Penicillium waksmanii]KAJ5979801.1 hypothetical protein N7481_007099 [Penicillium waksmanii]